MTHYGLTDLDAPITPHSHECSQCDTAWRVSHGLCLRCLLEAGLTEGEDAEEESLNKLLYEIE